MVPPPVRRPEPTEAEVLALYEQRYQARVCHACCDADRHIHSLLVCQLKAERAARRGGPAPFDDSDVFMHVTHRLLGSRAVGVTLGGVPLALQDMLTSADAVQTAPPSRPAPGRGVGDCSTALIWDTAAPRHTTAAQRTDRLDAASAAVLHESALFDWTPPQHAKAPVARAAAPGAGKAGKARPEWRDDF